MGRARTRQGFPETLAPGAGAPQARRHRAPVHPRRPRHVYDIQASRRAAGRSSYHPESFRPRVANDNPYSEAQFKTLKYCPAFPGRFGSLHDARAFCDIFFTYYNNEAIPGSGYTPASVHDGTAAASQARRQ